MSCSGGRLCFRVCSASSASLVHVRDTSLSVACTRGFGAPSANFSHTQRREVCNRVSSTLGYPPHHQKSCRARCRAAGLHRLIRSASIIPKDTDHNSILVSVIFRDRLRVQLHTAELDRVRRLRLRPGYSMLGATCIHCCVALSGSLQRHGQEPRLAKSQFLDQTRYYE